MSITERYLAGHRELARFLNENGYPIGKSTLAALSMPSRGRDDGPPVAGYWRTTKFYDRDQALAWAKRRFTTNRPGEGWGSRPNKLGDWGSRPNNRGAA
jgi:hypothetical protein